MNTLAPKLFEPKLIKAIDNLLYQIDQLESNNCPDRVDAYYCGALDALIHAFDLTWEEVLYVYNKQEKKKKLKGVLSDDIKGLNHELRSI